MKIRDVVCAVVRSGYFNKDLPAIKKGPKADGFLYLGAPTTPGFNSIVQAGEAISVMVVLEDGQVGFGDCADVILTGLAGRDPLFRAAEHLPIIEGPVRDLLRGRPLDRFGPLAGEVDRHEEAGKRLHTAVRYGVTQALLHAASLANHLTMAEIVAREYGCPRPERPVPILASCLTHDYDQIDRMILKRAELLPHSSFHIPERDLGPDGEKLLAYAMRLSQRISAIGAPGYRPAIHLDVYGTIGELFHMDIAAVAQYLGQLARAAAPFELLIETPVIAASKPAQIEIFRQLRETLRARGHKVKLIADEWCNTLDDIKEFADAGAADYAQIKTPDLGGINNSIEAVLYCRARGIGSCLGGSANETDQSARISAQVALACGADMMLSKPGFGGDEGLMILSNEMARALTLIKGRRTAAPA
jgi:methylaspartate ammonia-lyase